MRSGRRPDEGRRIVAAFEHEPWDPAVADFAIDDRTWAQLGAWCDYDPGDDLERLRAPTLVVHGGYDALVPVQASVRRYEATAATARRSQEVGVFSDGDHRVQTATGFAAGYHMAIIRWCQGQPLPA